MGTGREGDGNWGRRRWELGENELELEDNGVGTGREGDGNWKGMGWEFGEKGWEMGESRSFFTLPPTEADSVIIFLKITINSIFALVGWL